MAWFVADLVVLITVEGAQANVVHVNTVLVEAADPEEAWQLAHALGREGDHSYPNLSGQRVTIRFQGIAELSQVWEDPLEHGSELFFEERVDVPPAELASLGRAKDELAVFNRHAGPPDPRRPDCRSAEVHAEAVEVLRSWGVPHLRLVTDDEE